MIILPCSRYYSLPTQYLLPHFHLFSRTLPHPTSCLLFFSRNKLFPHIVHKPQQQLILFPSRVWINEGNPPAPSLPRIDPGNQVKTNYHRAFSNIIIVPNKLMGRAFIPYLRERVSCSFTDVNKEAANPSCYWQRSWNHVEGHLKEYALQTEGSVKRIDRQVALCLELVLPLDVLIGSTNLSQFLWFAVANLPPTRHYCVRTQ